MAYSSSNRRATTLPSSGPPNLMENNDNYVGFGKDTVMTPDKEVRIDSGLTKLQVLPETLYPKEVLFNGS